MAPQIRRFAALTIAGFGVVVGLIVLGNALTWWLPLGLVVFGVIATIPLLARGSLSILCAAVVAMLALVTFNVALGVVIEILPDAWVAPTDRLPIWAGLILAVGVFAWASYYYLRSTWLHPQQPRDDRATHVLAPAWRRPVAAGAALLVACAVILGLPPLVASIQAGNKPPPAPLPAAERLGPRLDVVIVSDQVRSDTPAAGGPVPAASALDVRFSVGQGRGRRVLWTRTGIARPEDVDAALAAAGSRGTAPPELRPRANAVIVLLVNPQTDCTDQLERWADVAGAVQEDVGAALPVVALLATSDAGAVACWRQSTDLVAVEELGSRTVTDAAVAAANAVSATQRYLDVAFAYRPILLFDDGERYPRPLSIEQMFAAGRIRQCPDIGAAPACKDEPVQRPEDLESPGKHLVIDKPRTDLSARAREELAAWRSGESSLGSAPADLLAYGSRIYVNPVPVTTKDRRQLLYLDYWWYLPDNPAGSGKRAFCGAGLVILGVTCFDHESDWEGVTVVLERAADAWEPLAMHYAEHESVVRYPWPQLRAYWDSSSALTDDLRRMQRRADRPLVFVAAGTHASYAHRCDDGCRQVPVDLEEGDHGGRIPWVGGDDEICVTVTCLALLPTTTGARGPASWNAFAGPWGERHCILRYYCDSGTPPAAPGQQDRYKDPAHYDGTADVTARDGGYAAGAE